MKFKEIKNIDGSFRNIRETDHCPAFMVHTDVDEVGNIVGTSVHAKYNSGNYDPSEVDASPFVDMDDPVSAAAVAGIEASIGALPTGVSAMDLVDTAREVAASIKK